MLGRVLVVIFFRRAGARLSLATFSNSVARFTERNKQQTAYSSFFQTQVEPDDTLCSDVACRTSAAPTFFPTYQSYVDGAIFANNPALSAIAKVLLFHFLD